MEYPISMNCFALLQQQEGSEDSNTVVLLPIMLRVVQENIVSHTDSESLKMDGHDVKLHMTDVDTSVVVINKKLFSCGCCTKEVESVLNTFPARIELSTVLTVELDSYTPEFAVYYEGMCKVYRVQNGEFVLIETFGCPKPYSERY